MATPTPTLNGRGFVAALQQAAAPTGAERSLRAAWIASGRLVPGASADLAARLRQQLIDAGALRPAR